MSRCYVYDTQNKTVVKTACFADTMAAVKAAMGDIGSPNKCGVKIDGDVRVIIIWSGSCMSAWQESNYPLGPVEFKNEFERIRKDSRRPRI